MCTTFLVNETLSSGRCGNYFRSFFMTDFHPRGIHSAGMSIFLLFLRRLWIALDANSHAVLKQCVASNRYARQSGENLPKVCPRKRRYPHFDYGKLSICANRAFYFIGSIFGWMIYQTKECVKFKICMITVSKGILHVMLACTWRYTLLTRPTSCSCGAGAPWIANAGQDCGSA